MVDVVDAVEVGGLRIAFEREGHGPPLLLLHGFVGDGIGTWRDQLDTTCSGTAWSLLPQRREPSGDIPWRPDRQSRLNRTRGSRMTGPIKLQFPQVVPQRAEIGRCAGVPVGYELLPHL